MPSPHAWAVRWPHAGAPAWRRGARQLAGYACCSSGCVRAPQAHGLPSGAWCGGAAPPHSSGVAMVHAAHHASRHTTPARSPFPHARMPGGWRARAAACRLQCHRAGGSYVARRVGAAAACTSYWCATRLAASKAAAQGGGGLMGWCTPVCWYGVGARHVHCVRRFVRGKRAQLWARRSPCSARHMRVWCGHGDKPPMCSGLCGRHPSSECECVGRATAVAQWLGAAHVRHGVAARLHTMCTPM